MALISALASISPVRRTRCGPTARGGRVAVATPCGGGGHLAPRAFRAAAAAASSSSTPAPSPSPATATATATETETETAALVDRDAPPRWSLVHARAVAAIAEVIVSRRDAQKVVRKALRPEWFGPEGAREAPGWGGDAFGGGINNAERAAIADAVLGVEVLRLRLAFIALTRVSAASAAGTLDDIPGGRYAFGADALAAILRRGGVRFAEHEGEKKSDGGDFTAAATTSNSKDLDLDRAAVLPAVHSMLALYWACDDNPKHSKDTSCIDERRESSGGDGRQQMDDARLAVLFGGDTNKSTSTGYTTSTLTEGEWPTDPTTRVAVECSLPRWLAARFSAQYDDCDGGGGGTTGYTYTMTRVQSTDHGDSSAEADTASSSSSSSSSSLLAAVLLSQGPVTIRRNRRLCPSTEDLRVALAAEGVEAVPLAAASGRHRRPPSVGAPDALVLPGGRPRCGIFGLETYHRGWFEVQDAGSQCIARAVADAVLAMVAAEEKEGRKEGDLNVNMNMKARKGRERRREGNASSTRVWRVLDMCAGNGGKALAVASALCSSSSGEEETNTSPLLHSSFRFQIDCYDVDERRLRHLRAAAARAGVEDCVNVISASQLRALALATSDDSLSKTTRGTGDDLKGGGDGAGSERDDTMLEPYDAVLVDVPCSSTGALRRFPSLRWEMDESKVLSASEEEEEEEDHDDDEDDAMAAEEDAGGRIKNRSSRRARTRITSFGWDAENAVAGCYDADIDAARAASSSTTTMRSWPALQREILGRSAALVRPGGGSLIYATCSLLDAENGANARWFERRRWGYNHGSNQGEEEEGEEEEEGTTPTFTPLPFPAGWPSAEAIDAEEEEEEDDDDTSCAESQTPVASHEVALLPHVHDTDGFYIARWVRSS